MWRKRSAVMSVSAPCFLGSTTVLAMLVGQQSSQMAALFHPCASTMVILFRSTKPPPVKTINCLLLGTRGRPAKDAGGGCVVAAADSIPVAELLGAAHPGAAVVGCATSTSGRVTLGGVEL